MTTRATKPATKAATTPDVAPTKAPGTETLPEGGADPGAAGSKPDEDDETEDKRVQERQEAEENARSIADDQRRDIAAGGPGELNEEGVQAAKGHSIHDPKAAPVDYSVQTARKPAQTIIPPDQMGADAMPRGPVANSPYGSEPRSFDPATGLAPAPDPAHMADVHGDDTDADTDQGASAALREANGG